MGLFMRRYALLILGLLAFASATAFGDENAEHALALINHVNWVVSKVVTTKSKVVLEAEYDGISADGLYLDCIEDQETIKAIKSVMQMITDVRLNEMERELLKEIFDEDKRNLIYSAIPEPTTINSPDIPSLAFNLASSVITGYMHYKQAEGALQRQLKKDNFRLDANEIEKLNNCNMELLQHHYDLVRKYRLPDKKRLTVKLLEELNQRINDTNANYQVRTYEYLRLNEEALKYLPEYWYFRGVYAGMNNKPKDEMAAYDRFQKIYFPFLRNDKVAASVAMNKCKLLISTKGGRGNSDITGKNIGLTRQRLDIEKQLEIILNNAKTEDWEFYYFCGLIYLHQLSNFEKACECLQKAVNYLDFDFSNKINSYYASVDKGEANLNLNGNWLNWDSDCLALCRLQLLKAMLKCKSDGEIGEYFNNFLKNMTVSPFEFFPYFKKAGLCQCPFLDYIISSAYIRIWVKWFRADDFRIIMPMSFFYSGFNTPTIRLLSNGKEIGQANYYNWCFGTGLSYTEVGPGCGWRGFDHVKGLYRAVVNCMQYELKELESQKVDCIDVEFKNKYHAVTLRFSSGTPGNLPNGLSSQKWISPTHIICDGIIWDLAKVHPAQTNEQIHRLLQEALDEK